MWSETGCQPVGNQSAMSWRSGGCCFLSECLWSQKGLRLFGDQLTTGRQPVESQSPTSLWPPETFLRSLWLQRGFTSSKQNLLATKSSLRPSFDTCNLFATSQQPPCNSPAASDDRRKNGRKEVPDRLQAMGDWGLRLNQLSIIFHAIYGAVCIQLSHFSYDDCETGCTLSYYHH